MRRTAYPQNKLLGVIINFNENRVLIFDEKERAANGGTSYFHFGQTLYAKGF